MTWTAIGALATPKRLVGIAKETTKGTEVSPSAYLPLDTFNPDDVYTMLPVTGMFGSMATQRGAVQGPGQSKISMGGAVFPDTVGWPLAGLLGDLTVTGSSAPYANAMAVLNSGQGQPSSHSVWDIYGATDARVYAATQWYQVELTFAAPQLLKYTATGFGLLSETEAVPSSPAVTALMPLPAWQFTCEIAGAATVLVTQATVTMTRKQDAILGLNGSQNPSEFYLGPLDVAWKLSCIADASDTALKYYLQNTQPSIDLKASIGTGSTEVGLEVNSNSVEFTTGPFKEQDGYLMVDLSGTANANTTNAGESGGESPVLVTLTNAVNGGYV